MCGNNLRKPIAEVHANKFVSGASNKHRQFPSDLAASITPMKQFVWFLALLSAAVVQAAENEFALGVRTTDPQSPTDQQKSFVLPDGFEIQLVTSEPDINKPMNMAFDATGRLWVTTSIEYPFAAPTNVPARDRLMIFEDFGPDGRARKVTEFADGLNIPIGIYPFRKHDSHWRAVVWSIPNIWLLEDTDGDGKADKREVLYGPFDYTRDTHGNQSSFIRGYDGWLYATHGFNNHSIVTGRDGNTVDMHSGNTYRMRLDGSRIEHFTYGQVNPFGMYLDALGNFYTADCHSAPMYQLLAGGYYPSFGKPHDGLGFAPVMLQHSHGSTAISGIVKYEDDLWPEEYRNRIFIGNVMTSRINQDEVSSVGSTPVAKEMDDFVKSHDPWFRPVNLQLGPDGALYIADFYNRIIGHYEVPLKHPGRDRERGRIWRVIHKGKPLRSAMLPDQQNALLLELGSPNVTRRLLALNELQDRHSASPEELTRTRTLLAEKLYTRPSNVEAEIKASGLWLMDRTERSGESIDAVAALADGRGADLNESTPDPVRVHAFRILTEQGRSRKAQGQSLVRSEQQTVFAAGVRGLSDPDALVRRCAAETLGVWASLENIDPLLSALDKTAPADTHLVYVLRKSIRDQLNDDGIFAQLDSLDLDKNAMSQIARIAVAVKSEPAGEFLIKHRKLYEDDPVFSSAAFQHAARHAPVASLDQLAGAVRQQSPSLDFQLRIFQAIEAGMQRRGLTLSSVLKQWAGDLSVALLGSIEGSTDWVNEPVDEFSNPRNPWAFQERVQADTGKPGRVLSSHPLGEGLTGRLVSRPFAAPDQLSFFLAGHDGYPDKPISGQNVVRLVDADSGESVRSASPPRSDVAQKVTWDLKGEAGRQVRFEVVDNDTAGAFAWLAFGRINPSVVSIPSVSPSKVAQRQIAATRLAAFVDADVLKNGLSNDLILLAKNPAADVGARSQAWSIAKPNQTTLMGIVKNSRVPLHWRKAIMDMVAAEDFDKSNEFQLRLFKEAPRSVQAMVTGAAIESANDVNYLLAAVESEAIPSSILVDRELQTKLNQLGNEIDRKKLQDILVRLPELDQATAKLVDQRQRLFDPQKANVTDGARLFEQLCANCHQLGGSGSLVGPQLDGIGNRGAERLIEDILDPNRNVDTAFRTTGYVLKNGDVESGLFRREDGAVLVLANGAGQEFTINQSDIAASRQSRTSLMPSNFAEALSQDQFNDLLTYLLQQR
jgi:putative heme-binding domain-containing protein